MLSWRSGEGVVCLVSRILWEGVVCLVFRSLRKVTVGLITRLAVAVFVGKLHRSVDGLEFDNPTTDAAVVSLMFRIGWAFLTSQRHSDTSIRGEGLRSGLGAVFEDEECRSSRITQKDNEKS